MGGGQPIKSSKVRMTTDVRAKRAASMYSIDERSTIRKSHELLHTHYTPMEEYRI